MKRFIVVILATVFTFFFLRWGIVAYSRLPSKTWTQLPTPNEQVVELVAAERWDLYPYIRTAEGTIYYCSENTGCTEAYLEGSQQSFECPELDTKDPPSPPGSPLDTLEVIACGVDSPSQVNFALLEDGTLWRWSYKWDWGPEYFANMVSPFAAAIVFVLGLLWLNWRGDLARSWT